MKCTTRLACSLALAMACVASPGIVRADATTAAPSYSADESPFVIDVKPIEKSKFGTTLQSLCSSMAGIPEAALASRADFDVNNLDQAMTDLANAVRAEKLAKSAWDDLKKATPAPPAPPAHPAAPAARAPGAAHGAAAAPAAPATPLDRAQATHKTRKTDAETKAKTVISYLHSLRTTCSRLTRQSSWKDLEEEDLTLLRKLRASKSLKALANALATRKSDVNQADSEEKLAEALVLGLNPELNGSGLFSAPSLLDSISPIGNLGDEFVNGLATFLMTRAKQEAIVFLQDRMRDSICAESDKTALGTSLLPNTCDTLRTLDAGASLHAMGTHMNTAAKKDLVLLPDISLQVATHVDPQRHYVYEPGRLAYAIARKIGGGQSSPLDVLASVQAIPARACEKTPGATYEGQTCKKVFGAVRLGSAFIYTVRSQDNLKDMIGGDETDVGPRLIAFGLDLEARVNRKFDVVKLRTAMTAFRDGANTVQQLQEALKAVQEAKGEQETAEQRRKRMAAIAQQAIVAMLELSTKLTTVLDAPNGEITKLLQLLDNAVNLGQASLEPDYGAMSVHMVALINSITQSLPQDDKDEKNKAGYTFGQTLKKITRYAPFVAEIASAKSSKDVAAAFEAAAAPVGSYKVKFDRTTVAVNAFVGLSGGAEWLLAERATGSSPWFGLSAPVGLHISRPFGEGGYLPVGAMLSVLDVGTLTQQRFAQDVKDTTKDENGNSQDIKGTASQASNFGWQQFFSPGVYVTVGLGSRECPSPFILGVGGSFVPNLRRVELTDAAKTSFDSPVFRFGAFLALDLTLFPLN